MRLCEEGKSGKMIIYAKHRNYVIKSSAILEVERAKHARELDEKSC